MLRFAYISQVISCVISLYNLLLLYESLGLRATNLVEDRKINILIMHTTNNVLFQFKGISFDIYNANIL